MEQAIQSIQSRIAQIQSRLGLTAATPEATNSTQNSSASFQEALSNQSGSNYSISPQSESSYSISPPGTPVLANTINIFSRGSINTQSSPGLTGNSVVQNAIQYLGVPYKWGGTNPAQGLDCSGLAQLVYSNLGIQLPRTTQQQVSMGQPVASLSQAQPGDLIFYGSPPYHVGIYIGNSQMIDAPKTGTDVQIQPVWGSPSSIRRIITSPTTTAPNPVQVSSFENSGNLSSLYSAVPSSLAPLFAETTAKYGLPPALLPSIAKAESNFNPQAISWAGAQGLMQLMPSTAAGLGANPFDPAQAINAAGQILAGNLNQFNSLPLAIAAYNAGAGAVSRYNGIPPYPQTQSYVTKVLSFMQGGL